MNKKSRNILSFSIALTLMFLVMTTSIVTLWDTTILNEKTYTKIFEKNNTYEKIQTSINEDIEYLLLVNNIPTDTLNGIISVDEINQYMSQITIGLVDIFKGKDVELPKLITTKYEQRFINSMNKFIRENGMILNEKGQQDLEQMKETVMRIISSDLQLIDYAKLYESDTVYMLSKVIGVISKIYIIIALIILIVITSLMLRRIWRKRPVRGSAWIGYSFISGGLMIFMFAFSGYISKFYENVAISIPYLAQAVSSIIEKYLLNLTVISLLAIIIGIFNLSKYWKHLYERNKRNYTNIA